jgi:hypothetical protein
MTDQVKEDMAMAPTNSVAGVASLNPNDPRNPPVGKKRSPKLLKDILKRKRPK